MDASAKSVNKLAIDYLPPRPHCLTTSLPEKRIPALKPGDMRLEEQVHIPLQYLTFVHSVERGIVYTKAYIDVYTEESCEAKTAVNNARTIPRDPNKPIRKLTFEEYKAKRMQPMKPPEDPAPPKSVDKQAPQSAPVPVVTKEEGLQNGQPDTHKKDIASAAAKSPRMKAMRPPEDPALPKSVDKQAPQSAPVPVVTKEEGLQNGQPDTHKKDAASGAAKSPVAKSLPSLAESRKKGLQNGQPDTHKKDTASAAAKSPVAKALPSLAESRKINPSLPPKPDFRRPKSPAPDRRTRALDVDEERTTKRNKVEGSRTSSASPDRKKRALDVDEEKSAKRNKVEGSRTSCASPDRKKRALDVDEERSAKRNKGEGSRTSLPASKGNISRPLAKLDVSGKDEEAHSKKAPQGVKMRPSINGRPAVREPAANGVSPKPSGPVNGLRKSIGTSDATANKDKHHDVEKASKGVKGDRVASKPKPDSKPSIPPLLSPGPTPEMLATWELPHGATRKRSRDDTDRSSVSGKKAKRSPSPVMPPLLSPTLPPIVEQELERLKMLTPLDGAAQPRSLKTSHAKHSDSSATAKKTVPKAAGSTTRGDNIHVSTKASSQEESLGKEVRRKITTLKIPKASRWRFAHILKLPPVPTIIEPEASAEGATTKRVATTAARDRGKEKARVPEAGRLKGTEKRESEKREPDKREPDKREADRRETAGRKETEARKNKDGEPRGQRQTKKEFTGGLAPAAVIVDGKGSRAGEQSAANKRLPRVSEAQLPSTPANHNPTLQRATSGCTPAGTPGLTTKLLPRPTIPTGARPMDGDKYRRLKQQQMEYTQLGIDQKHVRDGVFSTEPNQKQRWAGVFAGVQSTLAYMIAFKAADEAADAEGKARDPSLWRSLSRLVGTYKYNCSYSRYVTALMHRLHGIILACLGRALVASLAARPECKEFLGELQHNDREQQYTWRLADNSRKALGVFLGDAEFGSEDGGITGKLVDRLGPWTLPEEAVPVALAVLKHIVPSGEYKPLPQLTKFAAVKPKGAK